MKTLIEELRVKQVDMYIECEQKFLRGFKIFEKIVADRMLTTTNLRQDSLSKETIGITDKMKKLMASKTDLSGTEVAEWNKKLGISSPSSKNSKWHDFDDDDDDDNLTDDIAAGRLKKMFQKLLKKQPDIVDKNDMEFFGKYRSALQTDFKRRKIEQLLKDVDTIDKKKYRIPKQDSDKVLDELANIILNQEGKINKSLDKFKQSIEDIRQQSKEDAFKKRIRVIQRKEYGNISDSTSKSDTESESDSGSDSESDSESDEEMKHRKNKNEQALKQYLKYRTTENKVKDHKKQAEKDAYRSRKEQEDYQKRKQDEEFQQRKRDEEFQRRKKDEEFQQRKMDEEYKLHKNKEGQRLTTVDRIRI